MLDHPDADPVPRPHRPLWRRIVARTAVGLWRKKQALLLLVAALAAMPLYLQFAPALGFAADGPAAPAARAGGSDCADTAMAALAQKSPDAIQLAYQCLAPSFKQRVSEPQFAAQLQQAATPQDVKLARVGTYRPASGGATIVYYALDGGSQSVGYIVYLDPQGRVLAIE